MMTAKELAALVKKMRDRQKDYFNARRHGGGDSILSECKILEKQVDNAVRDVLNDKGPGLFEGQT